MSPPLYLAWKNYLTSLLVVNARSAQGLSLPAYILETLSYAITLAYSFRNDFPFSTYGENFFLTIQNVVITLLIISYAPSSSPKGTKLLVGAVATIVSSVVLYTLAPDTLSLLQLSTLPLSLFSKLPQIRQNARSQSTGQLSTIAVAAQIAGCAARLFTNATETGDNLLAAGFVLALLLNIVLGMQLWMYWGNGDKSVAAKDKSESYGDAYRSDFELKVEEPSPPPTFTPASWQASPIHRMATPPPRTSSASGSRKWARKVD